MRHLKNKILISFLFMIFILQGCATYPTDPAGQVQYWASKANSSIRFNKPQELWEAVHSASTIEGGTDAIKKVFENPKASEIFQKEALDRSEKYQRLEDVLFVRNQVYEIWLGGALPYEIGKNTLEELDQRIVKKHQSGEYLITLIDNTNNIGGLDNEPDRLIILKNSIERLKENSSPRRGLVQALMELASSKGVKSKSYNLIASNLADMNIRKNELSYVEPVFPEYAKKREAEVSLTAHLSLKNGDAFLKEDLLKALKSRVKGVTWVEESGPSVITIEIEKVRHDENARPPYTETVTYSQGQVNFFAGALLMPRNASYLFDISKSESMIEYGYIIRIAGTEEILVRGQEKGTSVNCMNARIQNVFGGVSPAGFVANNDMQSRCSGSGNKDMQAIRNNVYKKIAESVLKAPKVNSVHVANL